MKWNEIRNQQQQDKQKPPTQQQQPKKLENPYSPSMVGTTVTNLSTATRPQINNNNISTSYNMDAQGTQHFLNCFAVLKRHIGLRTPISFIQEDHASKH